MGNRIPVLMACTFLALSPACLGDRSAPAKSSYLKSDHVETLRYKLSVLKTAFELDKKHLTGDRRKVEELERTSLGSIGAEIRTALWDGSDLLPLYRAVTSFDWNIGSPQRPQKRTLEIIRHVVESAANEGTLNRELKLGALFVAMADLPDYLYSDVTTWRNMLKNQPELSSIASREDQRLTQIRIFTANFVLGVLENNDPLFQRINDNVRLWAASMTGSAKDLRITRELLDQIRLQYTGD